MKPNRRESRRKAQEEERQSFQLLMATLPLFLWEDLTPSEQLEAMEWWETHIATHTPGLGVDTQIILERIQDLSGGPEAFINGLPPWPMPPGELTCELEIPPDCREVIRAAGHYTPALQEELKRLLLDTMNVIPQHTRFRGQSVFVSLTEAEINP